MQSTLWRPSDILDSDAGGEADAPKRRGRIPHSAWPQILQRHRAGATLSELAREFDCTPSAISYIVRKTEATERRPGPDTPASNQGGSDMREPETGGAESGTGEDDAAVEPAPAAAVRRDRGAPPLVQAEERMTADMVGQTGRPLRVDGKPSESNGQGRAPVNVTVAAAASDPRSNQPSAHTLPETPATDELEARFREAAKTCVDAYRAWRTAQSDGTDQGLRDAIHEMRKAMARMEIEMSAGRRDERAMNPIPIPAHRAARRAR